MQKSHSKFRVTPASRPMCPYVPCVLLLVPEPPSWQQTAAEFPPRCGLASARTRSESNEISGGSSADTPSDGLITEGQREYAGAPPPPPPLCYLSNKPRSTLRLKFLAEAQRLVGQSYDSSLMGESLMWRVGFCFLLDSLHKWKSFRFKLETALMVSFYHFWFCFIKDS